VERHLLAGALRRERQNPSVNAIDEDDEGWYDLVQYRGERPQVWAGVHDEGVGERGSDGQHLAQPVTTGKQHHAAGLRYERRAGQSLPLRLDPGEVVVRWP
jgi:hypothetical protein